MGVVGEGRGEKDRIAPKVRNVKEDNSDLSNIKPKSEMVQPVKPVETENAASKSRKRHENRHNVKNRRENLSGFYFLTAGFLV